MTNMVFSYSEGRDTVSRHLIEVKQLPSSPIKLAGQYDQNIVQLNYSSGIIDSLLDMFWTLDEALEP